MENKYSELSEMIVAGDDVGVRELTLAMLEVGESAERIINDGLLEGMNIVGPLFKSSEMFLPEVLMSARAMKAGMEYCVKLLTDDQKTSRGKIVLGTVEGDIHDIGKDLVAVMLESAGFEVINLGSDIKIHEFVDAVKEHNPQILALSALMTSSMEFMQNTINEVRNLGEDAGTKIIIGGAPVSQNFADDVGADGYAPDGASAAEMCKQLLQSIQ